MILTSFVIFIVEFGYGISETDKGTNNKSPPCGLLHSNELYNNPNLTLVSEFPWVVSLKYTRDDDHNATNYSENDNDGVDEINSGVFLCTGSLINERYVLTSASCVDSKRMEVEMDINYVRIGKYNMGFECVKNLQSDDCSPSTMDVGVKRVVPFPSYNSTSLENNVALLELEENVTFTEYVRPICLEPNSTVNETGKEFWTSGYLYEDASKIIKAGNRIVISDEECKPYLNESASLTMNTFCTREGTKGPCISDAGGPLAFPQGEQWYQEGISSFTPECGASEAITTYTRLSNYIPWIKETAS